MNASAITAWPARFGWIRSFAQSLDVVLASAASNPAAWDVDRVELLGQAGHRGHERVAGGALRLGAVRLDDVGVGEDQPAAGLLDRATQQRAQGLGVFVQRDGVLRVAVEGAPDVVDADHHRQPVRAWGQRVGLPALGHVPHGVPADAAVGPGQAGVGVPGGGEGAQQADVPVAVGGVLLAAPAVGDAVADEKDVLAVLEEHGGLAFRYAVRMWSIRCSPAGRPSGESVDPPFETAARRRRPKGSTRNRSAGIFLSRQACQCTEGIRS